MKKTKTMYIATLAVLIALSLVGCKKKTPSLTLLVWEGYADPSFLRAFEESHNCKISASYMGSSDELVAKLRGGSASNYDVISPSSDVATMIASSGLAAVIIRWSIQPVVFSLGIVSPMGKLTLRSWFVIKGQPMAATTS